MPKIPTFTAKGRPTAEAAGVVSNIKIGLNQTVGAALAPFGKSVEDYYIKKRDNEEKLIAKKAVLELKAESDKIIQSQKDNISEDESINNWKTTFTPLINQKLSTVKNRRVKKLIESSIDLENSESIYHLKQNSFKAYEKESVKLYNDDVNADVAKFKSETNPKLKDKYRDQLYLKAELFNEEHMLGSNDLKKRKEAIDSVLLLTDADSFIGTPDAVEKIKQIDKDINGTKFLSDEIFNNSIYNSYEAKINSLAVEGDPNANYDEAIRLVNELENFERYNGNKVVSGTIEKSFAQLKERVLGESIRHEDKVTKIIQGNAFFDYSQGQKNILQLTFFNQYDASYNKPANREKAFEASQEYDQRIDAYVAANQDATYAEKQEYARDLRMNIIDKYKDIEIEKVTAFNLTSNKFNVTREADAVFELKKQYDIDPSKSNTLKTLAKLNGFVDEKGNPDVGALLNVYIPILQDRKKN